MYFKQSGVLLNKQDVGFGMRGPPFPCDWLMPFIYSNPSNHNIHLYQNLFESETL